MCVPKLLAQSFHTIVGGCVKDRDADGINNLPVYLVENIDTLFASLTDTIGEFTFETEFKQGNSYSLHFGGATIGKTNHYFNQIIQLVDSTDTLTSWEYRIEISLLPKCVLSDNSLYFKFNEIHESENVDAYFIVALLNQYPEMCLRIGQTYNSFEKRAVPKKRMNALRKLLEESGVNMNQIAFDLNFHKLSWEEAKHDVRSRIQGIVVSMEGNCFHNQDKKDGHSKK